MLGSLCVFVYPVSQSPWPVQLRRALATQGPLQVRSGHANSAHRDKQSLDTYLDASGIRWERMFPSSDVLTRGLQLQGTVQHPRQWCRTVSSCYPSLGLRSFALYLATFYDQY